ncbi:MAG: renalase [Candidatus Azotimanducaceae bacterium]|jgi:renalase
MNIAIIGTGIAAATLVYRLRQSCPGSSLQVFEKSRGIGGRMSTRRSDHGTFDHGTPFFTARSKSFQQLLKLFQSSGQVEAWQPKVITLSKHAKPYNRDWFETHYVATPGMNSLCKTLMADQSIQFNQTINRVSGEPGHWIIHSAEGGEFGAFDWVISTAPPEQTQAIFSKNTTSEFPTVPYQPSFALMVSCAEDYVPPFDAARVKDSCIDWLFFAHRKPGRSQRPSLVVHATGDYSAKHFDDDQDDVKSEQILELTQLIDIEPGAIQLHRWKYAKVIAPYGEEFWQSDLKGLAACGDWCLGNEVEHAYTSADALAKALTQALE